ncbi:MAG TPA: DUF6178 family protein, partial [Polyangiaceae bacterium]|nr:DUF6178 family protein [Polyangiaceae bacterium]
MGKLRVYVPPSPLRLLEHVLESPALVRAVRELPPAALGKLIDAIGLEDAGELVALATTSQLEAVFDEDLWKPKRPGADPDFDPARFGLWLQVLGEAGEKAIVERLCELPVDLLILAVTRLALVVDMDELWVELSDDEEALELTEKAIDGVLAEEIEEFRLFSRDDAHFDVLVSALTSLDRDHSALLRQILEKAAAVSSEYIRYNGGLYDVLTGE